MAYFLWVGAGATQDLGLVGNWRNSDAVKSNLSPATSLPVAGDMCWVVPGSSIGLRTSSPIGSCYGDVDNCGTSINGISGGTFYGAVTNRSYIFEHPVFNGVLNNNSVMYGGTCNGPVFNTAGGGDGIYAGIFNGPVQCTINGRIGGLSVVINNKLSLDNGLTWVYSPNSPAVAPASKVLKRNPDGSTNSNLGIAGALNPDVVLTSAGAFRRR